jgi:hypothetical protein
VIFCVRKFPKDGAPVPKHVVGGTYHELLFMICILLYFISALVGEYNEYTKMLRMNNIKICF